MTSSVRTVSGVQEQNVVRVAGGDQAVVRARESEIAGRALEIDFGEPGSDHLGGAVQRGVVEHPHAGDQAIGVRPVALERSEARREIVPSVVRDDEDVYDGLRCHEGGPRSATTMCR